MEKQQHMGLDGRSRPSCPPPHSIRPQPGDPGRLPLTPGALESSRKTLGAAPIGPCSGSAPGAAAATASAAGGGHQEPKAQPTGPPWASSRSEPRPAPHRSPGAGPSASLSAGRPRGLRAGVGVGAGEGAYHWTEAFCLWQLSKPRVWNTPSRRATVEADTSGGCRGPGPPLDPSHCTYPGEARPELGQGGAQLGASNGL